MTSSPLPQLSFLSELCVQNMFNFVRNYTATPHLSVDTLEKFSCTGLNTVVCSLTELHHVDLIVIYKFSVLSAVSEKIHKVPFEQFCLQLAGTSREKAADGQLNKHIVRLIYHPFRRTCKNVGPMVQKII